MKYLATLLLALLSADKPYVKVSPQVAMAPCTIRVTVHYPAGAYAVRVIIGDENGVVRDSAKEVPGRTWNFPPFKDLPAAAYEVTAVVVGLDGRVIQLERKPIICQGVE